jgi:predicted lysophospholipase L1 biosynthesis ABC-type transport system permease subunit
MQVYDNVKQGAIYNDERKRQAAFRWLGEQAGARRAREERTFRYVRWTFFAAVAAVIVGIAGIAVTMGVALR